MRNSIFFTLLLLASSGSARAAEDTSAALRANLVETLTFMKSVYSAKYAPAQWKKSYEHWDLDTQINAAIQAAQTTPSLDQRGAREILKNFIYSMKDYHTSIRFTSTEAASLPFLVKSVGDRYFIVYINRSKLSEAAFPYEVGDELVTFGGKPTTQAVAEVQAQIPANQTPTDHALAEIYLTKRSGARGYAVPQGPVTISVKSQATNQVSKIELIWDYTPEKIKATTGNFVPTPNGGSNTFGFTPPDTNSTNALSIANLKMDVKLFDPAPGRASATREIETPYDLGSRSSFTPALGTKIWSSDPTDHFDAYIYQAPDTKLYGYLRIPQYEVDTMDTAVAEFRAIVLRFEQITDALVIDQVDNPGGSVMYLYTLASMLAVEPLTTPLHQISIAQAEVADAVTYLAQLEGITDDAGAKKALGATLEGYPTSYELAQFLIRGFHFVIDQWNTGHKLSSPTYIEGIDHINPAPIHYTKPILLLTNSLDFSGGDFFPAILQDNKRVTILGTRTAGAGGYVADVTYPNNLGVASFRVTESIAKRVSDNPIENLGVKPDIEYSMSVNDYTSGYPDYAQAIQSALSSLVSTREKLKKP